MPKLYKLESLRGIAACLVIIFHSRFHFYQAPLKFFENSYLFVDFFFILSGFVMALAYTSRIKEGLPFKSYLILRLGRIYPLHIFMLFIWLPYIFVKQYFFQAGLGGTNPLDTNNIGSFIANILLINSMGVLNSLSWNTPSWSISTEFFAYIFFYFAISKLDKNNSLLIPIIISSISYGILASNVNLVNRSSLNITYSFGFFRCLGAFYLGVFIYRFKKFSSVQEYFEKHIFWAELACILAITIFVSMARLHFSFIFLTIISFALCIYTFSINSSGLFGKLLLSKPLKALGQRSYSIYMLQMIIVGVFTNIFEYLLKFNLNSALGYRSIVINILIIMVTIGLSKYTYSYIEVFFINKSRLIANKYMT